MRIRAIAVAFLVLAMMSKLTMVTAAQERPATSSPKDTAAIEALVAGQADAWNKHDAKAFSVRFASDGSFTNIIGETTYGRDAFEEDHLHIFTTIYKDSSVQLAIGRLRFLRPDVAVVDVDTKLSGFSRLPPGIKAAGDGALHCKLQLVAVKEKGEWWISAFHNVAVTPIPPRP